MLFPEEKKVFYNINPQEKLTICSAFYIISGQGRKEAGESH